MLLKYSAKNWPFGQPPAGLIVKVSELDAMPGFVTLTKAEPAVAMSAAAMPAVSRVALTNVVGRGLPFHCTSAPDKKLLPTAVSVNAGPPAGALHGVLARRARGPRACVR